MQIPRNPVTVPSYWNQVNSVRGWETGLIAWNKRFS
jgi:hypothetical protein